MNNGWPISVEPFGCIFLGNTRRCHPDTCIVVAWCDGNQPTLRSKRSLRSDYIRSKYIKFWVIISLCRPKVLPLPFLFYHLHMFVETTFVVKFRRQLNLAVCWFHSYVHCHKGRNCHNIPLPCSKCSCSQFKSVSPDLRSPHIGVTPLIIHFRLGFSLINHPLGVPPWLWKPPYQQMSCGKAPWILPVCSPIFPAQPEKPGSAEVWGFPSTGVPQ